MTDRWSIRHKVKSSIFCNFKLQNHASFPCLLPPAKQCSSRTLDEGEIHHSEATELTVHIPNPYTNGYLIDVEVSDLKSKVELLLSLQV